VIIGRGGALGETVIVRLQKGELLLEGIAEICRHEGIRNGVILTGFGSLYESCWSGALKPDYPPREFFRETSGEALEILAISGVIADYHVHAHMVLSTRERAFGGHVEPGCRVFSLVELAIAKLEHLKLQRHLDPETKQKLLQVVARYEGMTADTAYSLVDTTGPAE
jgi:uncharacterized protein